MKPLNANDLCHLLVHWLKYQYLCGRDSLFCEGLMSQPIGEYALSLDPEHFEPEHPYPNIYQANTRRKRSMDFAIYQPPLLGQQKVLAHAIETKFVTSNRGFMQEVYDDLYRLLWFQPSREPAVCKRWLIVAGFKKNISGPKFLGASSQIGAGRGRRKVDAFTGLLSGDLNNAKRTKDVHGAVPEIRKLWEEAAEAFGSDSLPDQITVRLAARYPPRPKPAELCCFIWEIVRPQPNFQQTFARI